ncbi:MAG: hypothetical protein ACRD2I_05650 [Vicinamibacterales bacterium]
MLMLAAVVAIALMISEQCLLSSSVGRGLAGALQQQKQPSTREPSDVHRAHSSRRRGSRALWSERGGSSLAT